MRNGNSPSSCRCSSFLFVLTVPMRNGNSPSSCRCSSFLFVLTVPMRNGNSNFQTAPQAPSSSSYRTYEEWKPLHNVNITALNIRFLPYLWGMETYKANYKISRDNEFLPYLWGMETYKANYKISRDNEFLPYLWGMETWIPSLSQILDDHTFLPYLWGMETIMRFMVKSVVIWKFLPYLWGMETLTSKQHHKHPRQVLTVPMRNGNPSTM